MKPPKLTIPLVFSVMCLSLISGCGKAVFIRPGTATLLGKPVKAEIYAPDETGKTLVKKSAEIPAGTVIIYPDKSKDLERAEKQNQPAEPGK